MYGHMLNERRAEHIRYLLRRYRRTANLYPNRIDWLSSIYSDIARLTHSIRLPFRNALRRVRSSRLGGSVLLRMGSSDWFTYEEIALSGEYMPFERGRLANVQSVVDLGSNIGLSVRLWQQNYPGCRVVAVEPDPANARMIRFNTGKDVQLFQTCIAGSRRTVALDRTQSESAFRMVDQVLSTDDMALATMTMDDILSAAGITGNIDLLKCDIEGAEGELFGNCRSWIKRVRNLVVEIHPPYSRDAFLRDLCASDSPLRPFEEERKGEFHLIFLTQD
jgi:FkbM family methyltransferase